MRQIFIIAMALFACACQPQVQFLNNDIQGAGLATQVPLTTFDGQVVQLSAPVPHQVTAVFFGYTQCPDVCPTTMGEMKRVKQLLGADADKLRAVFVTVDPERDTANVLKQYSAAFTNQIIGVYTTPAQTKTLASNLNISYEKIGTGDFYTVNHSSNTYLIDAQGKFRVSVPYGTKAEAIVHDVKQLLRAP